jgi:hypothetical protein
MGVWTGTEMIIWGGFHNPDYPQTGGRYNLASNSWRSVSSNTAPEGRTSAIAAWTGHEMLIFGGTGGQSGGRYDPVTGLWAPITSVGAPENTNGPEGIWTGTQLLLFGGIVNVNGFNEFQDDVLVYEPGKTLVIYQHP